MQKILHALRSAMTRRPVAHRTLLSVYFQLPLQTLMSALRQSILLLSYSPDGGSYISFRFYIL